MRPYRLFPLIAALLLAVGTLVVACGGGGDSGELTLEQYVRGLETLFEDASQRRDALEQQYRETPASGGSVSDEERVRHSRERLNELVFIAKHIHDELDQMKPPARVKDAHRAFLKAMEDFAEGYENFISSEDFEGFVIQLESIEFPSGVSQEELEELSARFHLSDLAVLSERLDEVCAELEGIAADNGIDIDLCDDV